MHKKKFSFYTEDYLQQKFSLNTKEDNLWVNGSICPDINLVNAIKSLSDNQCLKHNETLIAFGYFAGATYRNGSKNIHEGQVIGVVGAEPLPRASFQRREKGGATEDSVLCLCVCVCPSGPPKRKNRNPAISFILVPI